ncbi:MAG: epoxyqueuosine reductase QueH [Bacillota bacterium]
MDLLLHICCAPCSIFSWEYFSGLGYSPRGYFFNPNIHPYREFVRRMETLRDFGRRENRPVIFNEDYLLEDFLSMAIDHESNRCHNCYRMRLLETARKAREAGIGHFSTTLLISPYQKHVLLKSVGEEAAQRHGVNFVYADLRSGFRESMEQARKKEIYRQGYCGCIFSEKERYHRPK